jgi:F0F1-type ATP synthase membrane subunit a
VETLNRLLIVIRETMDEWLRVRWSDVQFAQKDTAVFMLIVLLAISVFMVVARRLRARKPGRTHVSLPAVLPVMRRSYASAIRHGALIVFALGIPFFAIALAAPQTGFTREEISSGPPRRIGDRLFQ